MDAFAGRLFRVLGPGNPFKTRDAAFILAFSTIMLNTDLHNDNIPEHKKMTMADFIRSICIPILLEPH
jgi:Sec7-like guanine-nucleotide exchange factor